MYLDQIFLPSVCRDRLPDLSHQFQVKLHQFFWNCRIEREEKKKKDVMKACANKASMLKNIELEEAHLDDKYLKTQQH